MSWRRDHGLAILVASEDALDQFFAREPDAPSRRVEAAILDHANSRILDPHVLAAAFEAPLDERDAATLGAEALAARPSFPSSSARPRASSGRDATIRPCTGSRSVPETRRLTVVDAETGSRLARRAYRAFSTVHQGAVYLHLGEQFLVESLDLDERIAFVASASVDWYTQ